MTMIQQTISLKPLKSCLLAAVAVSALMAGFAPVTVEAARPTSEKSLGYLETARTHVTKQNWRAAVIELKNALQADPDNVDARILLGEAYIKMRNGPAAEKEFRAALERGADKNDMALRLGDAYLLQRKFQEALDLLKSAKLPKERLYEAELLRANAFIGLRQVDASKAAYAAAEKLNPKDGGAKIGLSRVYLLNREFDEAGVKIDQALAIDPRNVEALLIKGELARLKTDFKGAFSYFDTAVGIEPDNLSALLGRATTLTELNRFDEAKRDIDAVFKQAPNHPTAHYLAARIAWQKKDVAGAREHLQATGAALENFAPAIFLSGLINFSDNNLEQAAYHLSRLLQLAPNHTQARRVLGMTYLRQGDQQQAIKVLEPVVAEGKADAQIYSLLGYAYMQSGELDKGSQYFDKAVELDPKESSNWTRLAVSKMALGDYEAAEGDLEKVLEKDPKALQPAIILTMISLRKGDYTEALALANKLKKLHADNPIGLYFEGEAFQKLGKNAEARKAYVAAQMLKPSNFTPTLRLAQIDIAENKLDVAEGRYRGILSQNPGYVAAMIGMADIASRRDRTSTEATTWLEQAANADQDNVNVRLQLISQYVERQELDKAEAVASELTRRFPDQPISFEAMGRVQTARGDKGGAVASFERVTALRPTSSGAHQLLAQAELVAGNTADARIALLNALKHAPAAQNYEQDRAEIGTLATVLAQLVELEVKEKAFPAALNYAAELAKRYPKSDAGKITEANIYLEKGDHAKALAIYEPLLAAGKGGTVLAINRYRAEVGLGKQAAAFQNLEGWVAKNPSDAVARNVLASSYISAGQLDPAIGHYETLHKANSKDALTLNNLAWLYQQKGDKRAVEVAAEAYKLAPQSPEIMDTYAWILVTGGSLPQGLDLLKKAITLRPGSPDIRYHLAVALNKSGQQSEARRELEDLFELGVPFGEEKDARALLEKLSKR